MAHAGPSVAVRLTIVIRQILPGESGPPDRVRSRSASSSTTTLHPRSGAAPDVHAAASTDPGEVPVAYRYSTPRAATGSSPPATTTTSTTAPQLRRLLQLPYPVGIPADGPPLEVTSRSISTPPGDTDGGQLLGPLCQPGEDDALEVQIRESGHRPARRLRRRRVLPSSCRPSPHPLPTISFLKMMGWPGEDAPQISEWNQTRAAGKPAPAGGEPT